MTAGNSAGTCYIKPRENGAAVAPPQGGEESPDSIEQGFLPYSEDAADHIPRKGQRNRKYTAFQK